MDSQTQKNYINFHKLLPKNEMNEMNEMGHLMNKNRAQAQRTA